MDRWMDSGDLSLTHEDLWDNSILDQLCLVNIHDTRKIWTNESHYENFEFYISTNEATVYPADHSSLTLYWSDSMLSAWPRMRTFVTWSSACSMLGFLVWIHSSLFTTFVTSHGRLVHFLHGWVFYFRCEMFLKLFIPLFMHTLN